MPIEKKTVKLSDGANIDHDDNVEAEAEAVSSEDFNIGAGGGGLMPNALTRGQERGQYWKDVETDINKQKKATRTGKDTPDGEIKGASAKSLADIPFTQGSRQVRAAGKK